MSPTTTRIRRLIAVAGATGLALAITSCSSERGTRQASAGGEKTGTFVFAAASEPVALDPAFVADSESTRVANQIFEGLVSIKPGTAEPAPGLATSWSQTDDGLSYTFQLRKDVKFSDGTPFDAEAVCFNFERWYNWNGPLQAENISNLYQLVFAGFRTSDNPALTKGIYKGCAAQGDAVTITLTRPYGSLVPALAISSFAMQSPTALKQYKADDPGASGDVRRNEYSTAHPTGTGPYLFESWEKGQRLTLRANPTYWGGKPKIDKIVVRIIPDGTARLQALQSGEIDGYDLVAPADVQGLSGAGFQVLPREPLNILYLGMNQADPLLADIRVRKAIAHALDKQAIVSQTLPAGTKPAEQFIPPPVNGYADGVTTYDYDPAKAKKLLEEAGATGKTVTFNYPTGTSRPYMPSPEDTFVAIRTQLEAVGLKVNAVPEKWSPEYLERIKAKTDHGLYLLGGTGIMNSADTFLGIFFGRKTVEWGFEDKKLFESVAAARSARNLTEQGEKYATVSKELMDLLPGIPVAHPVPSLALSPRITGYVTSPLAAEVWNTLEIKG
ncbi:ABC transporter substrate-binding protein [Streptosporangium saharense]|uniref:ABC transporter substrate-binding protein n=1 Tax=Streptosporangium saharense TaxID=1706840 RepID=UPI00331BB5E6